MKCTHRYLLPFVIGSSSLSQLFTPSVVAMKQNLFKNENKKQVQEITKQLLVNAITKACKEGGFPENLFNLSVHPYFLALVLDGHVDFSYREIVDALQGGLLKEVKEEFQNWGGISNDFRKNKNKADIIENISQNPPDVFNKIEGNEFNLTKDSNVKKDEQKNILNQNQNNFAPFANDNLIEVGLTKKSIIECVPELAKTFTYKDPTVQNSDIHVEYKACYDANIDLFVNVNNKNSEIFEKSDINVVRRRFPEAPYIHPYDPQDFDLPSFVLNLKFPKDVDQWGKCIPQFVQDYLRSYRLKNPKLVPSKHLDNVNIFCVMQSVDQSMQCLKPHGWAFGGKTFEEYKTPYNKSITIDAVAFNSLRPVTSDFVGNDEINLMNPKPAQRTELAYSAKNDVKGIEDNTIRISISAHDNTCSGDVMQLKKLVVGEDNAFYTVCIFSEKVEANKDPEKEKAALTLHIILKDSEMQAIKDALCSQYEKVKIQSSISFKQIYKTICGALLNLKTEDAKHIVDDYLRSWMFKMLFGNEI
jgi:hypothetical protein